jgi:primosomal protein N' (replication factor Y) (superfamily II helicase)
MIADVAFDAPVNHPFSYQVPPGLGVAPGQRVVAPLGGARRVGMVVRVREGHDERLRVLTRTADASPVLTAAQMDLVHWIAAESLSSVGSTCAALLPPAGASAVPPLAASRLACDPARPTVLAGAGRERRTIARIVSGAGAVVVIAPDVETAARWAQRLGRTEPAVRLDPGAGDDDRATAWARLAAGTVRIAVGTRSALLAPLVPPATLVLLDEHDAAHRPPGPPRIHAREVVLERATREGLDAVLTAATPSVEAWWGAARGTLALERPEASPWPAVEVTDTRGILRREPITPPLARAIRETLAARRRVLLVIARLTSTLACDDCGEILRCPACALALAYSRAERRLACRLCGIPRPLPETCPACRGRRLSPFGWGAERVEHAVRRRFPSARVARYDPEARRGARGDAQRAAAAAADVVVGTRGALRLFGPASLGLVGFVAPDQLLRLPDFRAGERLFALGWAAAERTAPDGRVIVQSQNPEHYALEAVVRCDLDAFYRQELAFRAELGYPPFRRLAVLTIAGRRGMGARPLAERVAAALAASDTLTVYPAAADRRGRAFRLVVKGAEDLPHVLAKALDGLGAPTRGGRGIIQVEVDPVEWPS